MPSASRRTRRPAAARRRPSPARSALRCWRWWPRCRRRRPARPKSARRSTPRATRSCALRDAARRAHRRDAAAYDLVVAAYRLPKGTDEEKAARKSGDPGRDARRDGSAARNSARVRRRRRSRRTRGRRARQSVGAKRRRRRRSQTVMMADAAAMSTSRRTSAASRIRPSSSRSPTNLRALQRTMRSADGEADLSPQAPELMDADSARLAQASRRLHSAATGASRRELTAHACLSSRPQLRRRRNARRQPTPSLEREVDEQRLALDVGRRQEAPVPAVLRVVAVVAHHEVLPGRHRHRAVLLADVVAFGCALGRRRLEEVRVRLVERLCR